MLRKHKAAQAAEKLRAGDQWTDSGLVFTTELGGPVDPRNFLRIIEDAAQAAGVAGVGVHTLRHSAAVGWLEAGVHIKAVADKLGGVSRTTVYDLVNRRELVKVNIGRRGFITGESLAAYVGRLSEAAPA
jgi:site-specific recombinase XerD